jgi:TP901 family phage tail tape measure protein
MAIEKLTAQIVPTVDAKASAQAEAELRRLSSPKGIKLATDLASLRQQLSIIRGQIRMAENKGDFTGAIKLRVDAEVLSKQLTQANRQLTNFTRTGSTDLSAFQKGLNGVSGGITRFIGGMTASFLSVTALFSALKGISNIGRSFETAFTGVQKTVSLSAENMELLRRQLLQLSKEIPSTFEEISKIAAIVGQLGISGDQIRDFTKTIALLGVTTNLSTEEAAFALARFQTQLKVSGEDIDNVGSTIVALGNNFATTERDIIAFAERITGVGSIVGLTVQETLAIATAFASVGIEAEAGGTAVQKAFLDMNSAVNSGGKDLQRFATIAGMTATEFSTLFRDDAGVAFQKFVQGLAESGAQAGQVLEELGLADARQQRAFLSLAASGGELQRAMELANLAFADNNALTKEAENRFKTQDSQIQILQNRWRAFFSTMGDGLNKTLLPVYQRMTRWATVEAPYFFDIVKLVFTQSAKVIAGYRDVAVEAFNNIGDSAKIIPYAIQGALNLAITALGKFINIQLTGINLLIKAVKQIPGMEGLKTIDATALLPKISVVEAPKFMGGFKDTFIKNLEEMKVEAYDLLAKREDAEEIFIEKQKGRIAQEVKQDQQKVQDLLAQNDKKNKGLK